MPIMSHFRLFPASIDSKQCKTQHGPGELARYVQGYNVPVCCDCLLVAQYAQWWLGWLPGTISGLFFRYPPYALREYRFRIRGPRDPTSKARGHCQATIAHDTDTDSSILEHHCRGNGLQDANFQANSGLHTRKVHTNMATMFRTSWILIYLTFLHLVGIYLFTRGFLLSRLSLYTVASCADPASPCTLKPTHKRAVLLIIDSLRFDFLSPHPPEPHSPYHHNVLTIPRELTAKQPRNSFLFNAHADPPTVTLQRIKALVTGSLPTFVDIGHNFGGASIAEDSIIQQLQLANRTVRSRDLCLLLLPNSFVDCLHGR
jgi:hypothetical protein